MKKKLISNDIKKLVQSAINSGYKPVKFKLERFTRIAIGNVYVTKLEGHKPVMNVTEHFNGEYAKLWNNDVGKILIKELNNDDNNLYEIITDKFKALIKLISKDELSEFKANDMIHVNIGDNEYTIIKVVTAKRYYCDKTDDYDTDLDIEDDTNEYTNDDSVNNDNHKSNSHALF